MNKLEKAPRILLAEDEPKLSLVLQEELNAQGYETDVALDGKIAEKLFEKHPYSLILLDINLPYKNGLTLCKEFRKTKKKTPILIITALGEIEDKIEAFNLGVDDYIVKPFHLDELFARIKVALKRTEEVNEPKDIYIDDLKIDFATKSANRAGKEISLSSKEFTLLVLLARNRGKVVSKQEILEKVWDLSFETGTNNIEVYISFLRNKIDKPFNDKMIFTKPGFGYFIR